MEIKTPPFLQINGVGEHGVGFATDFVSKTEASHRRSPLWTHSKAECSPGLMMSPVQLFLPKAPIRYITPSALGINTPDGQSKQVFLLEVLPHRSLWSRTWRPFYIILHSLISQFIPQGRSYHPHIAKGGLTPRS